jgi:hypothetical protein
MTSDGLGIAGPGTCEIGVVVSVVVARGMAKVASTSWRLDSNLRITPPNASRKTIIPIVI